MGARSVGGLPGEAFPLSSAAAVLAVVLTVLAGGIKWLIFPFSDGRGDAGPWPLLWISGR